MKKNSALPLNDAEFTIWADEIIRRAAVPDEDGDFKYALASVLMQLPADVAHKPIQYFVDSIRKAAINKTAYKYIAAEREKRLAAQKEADAAKQEANKAVE